MASDHGALQSSAIGNTQAVLPRLIAIDLDGTLLDSTGRVSQRAVNALRAARDAGIIVAFATGRPPFVATAEIAQCAEAVSYGVMANGSIICTLPDAQPLRTLGFPTPTARAVIAALRAADDQFGFALASDCGYTAEFGFAERLPVQRSLAPVVDALVGHESSLETFKLLVFHQQFGAFDLLSRIPALLAATEFGPTLRTTHMGAEAVEVGPAEADKGNGLRWLCDHLGISGADVVVFGDEINDLSMFEYGGHSVAVANAAPAVLAAADYRTGSNDADGVATFIESLVNRSITLPEHP